MDLFDILIEIADEGFEEGKKLFGKAWKYVGAASSLGAASFLSKDILRKKFYWEYLDYTIHDIYPARDLTKHVWISGAMGSGKSNKLRRIFINSFVKKGWGGLYIDTHGTADLILQSIPPNRWKDVIYIAPWMGKVYGINVLQRHSDEPGEIDKIAEDVVDVFSKMYPRAWGDKIANCIRFATKAVLIAEENNPDYNNPTLIDVYKMLKNPLFRDEITKNVDNEIITEFFEALKATTAVDKLSNPLSSENVMLFLCQKNGIDILKAMNEKKIIIANLDNNHLSNNGNLLAAMLISTVAKCAAKRKEDNEKESPYFALAMDEFHEYANKHIATIISQMRKKNVCALLANQYRDQTPQKEIQSAISMCQFKFIHAPAQADIRYVVKEYRTFMDEDIIVKMPFFHCIQDEHKTGKPRNPFITPVPKYKGDYDWDYVHKLKFASLHSAPYRYKLIEEINKVKVLDKVDQDETINTGEIILPEGELPYESEF
jgi:hypothetical protein